MNQSLKEQLQKYRLIKPKEVWLVADSEVVLHSDKRKDKIKRPVLVLMSKKAIENTSHIINCIPLTASAKRFDSVTFPIHKGYKEIVKDFSPNENSAALIQFYQPIERKYFDVCVGTIDDVTYSAIDNIVGNY
ncbi:MAG: hypothetical protein SFU91_08170 [Chloroherpetonaceae bacterium]|nr:hypothetical protein [Chloroherpetonaceae bacterium]